MNSKVENNMPEDSRWAKLVRALEEPDESFTELEMARFSMPDGPIPPGWLPPPARPGVVSSFDGLHLVQFLGMGSMGIVFKALMEEELVEETGPSKKWKAVKLLRPELHNSGMARSRFQKEVRMVSRLKHPNIIGIPKVAEVHGLSYFVMDYMEGGSLTSRCTDVYFGEPESIRDLILAVAGALEYCHARGVIHRDVKPSNILFDQDGCPVLADFGLARTVWNDSMMEPGNPTPIGTPAYLSPKAVRGESDDTRGDIYSLGAVLYELLAGRPPYSGQDVSSILEQIKRGPPAPIQSIRPDADSGLVRISERAMARELKGRYSEISEMIRDLRAWTPSQGDASTSRQFIEPLSPRKFGSGKRIQKLMIPVLGLVLVAALVTASDWFLDFQPRKSAGTSNAQSNVMESNPSEVPRLVLTSTISLPGISAWHLAKMGDWTGHRRLKLFHYSRETETLRIVNPEGTVFQTFRIPSQSRNNFALTSLFDLNRDGRDDLVFSWKQNDDAGLSFYNQYPHEFKTLTIPGTKKRSEDGSWYRNRPQLQRIVDLDHDGRLEVLATINTGYELQPRGLVCLDLESGREKWGQYSGPWMNGVDVMEAGENHPALVSAGGNSLGNKAIGPDGLSDDIARAYLFRGDGERLWSADLVKQNHVYVDTRIADLNRDGDTEVLALVHCAEYNDEQEELGIIYLFDLNGELIAEYNLGASSKYNWLVDDIDTDRPGQEIAVIDRKGILHILDSRLSLISAFQLGDKKDASYRTGLMDFVDLDNDGRREWLILLAESELITEFSSGSLNDPPNGFAIGDIKWIVLSGDGSVLLEETIEREWNHGFGFRGAIAHFSSETERDILFLGADLRIYRYQNETGAIRNPGATEEIFLSETK